MAFMQPEYIRGLFYDVENEYGEGTLVPGDLVGADPALEDFEDYMEWGKPEKFEPLTGWFVRLQAPGYCDATSWSGPYDNEYQARRFVEDFWEVDADTGDDLPEDSD